jgi:hypothetical protein
MLLVRSFIDLLMSVALRWRTSIGLAIACGSADEIVELRDQKQAVNSSGTDTHRYALPVHKALPEQQVCAAQQEVHTRGKAMPGLLRIGSRQAEQQDADQECEPWASTQPMV